MHIPFIEPVSPRYIHINPVTNRVHLMVPVVGGQEISTDNTCKATAALKEFFDGGVLRELNTYKDALEFDIQLLAAGSIERTLKEERLTQIHAYIEAVSAMRFSYGSVLTAFLAKPSNLYSIQLRPRLQDHLSRVVNPAFTIERRNNSNGIPLSPLYNAMHGRFPTIAIAPREPRGRLTTAVLADLSATPTVADIQGILSGQCQHLFGLTIDFTHQADGTVVDKVAIDTLMGFSATNPATSQEYIDALLGMCASDIWKSIPTPPFYSIPATILSDERTERLSILTQFFLANVNVYCKARGISVQNFGAILDTSPELSEELVNLVASTLVIGGYVEGRVVAFINIYQIIFGLSQPLTPTDVEVIRQQFERTYRTVTATNENPHMDDFMILDLDATGEIAKFVTHQGSLCVNFAEIVDPTAASANSDYFASIRADFATHPAEIPHRNEIVAGQIEVDIETLLAVINDEQFESLPQAVKDSCRTHPSFQLRQFLHDVAKGRQEEAEALLITTPDNTQTLLQTPGVFTDYSGRRFNCTAYEYTFWAKDKHMRQMLESHMDEETKALLLARIDEMESSGLEYLQQGETHRTKHFDLTPLNQALQAYVDGYDNWHATNNWAAIATAWMAIGKAQRDVPAHIAQEYCRPDRSFSPAPQFNETALPRTLTFHYWNMGASDSWFPLLSPNSGLGFDFALSRGGAARAWSLPRGAGIEIPVSVDFAAIAALDEVRTVDLTLSRDHLNPPASLGLSM